MLDGVDVSWVQGSYRPGAEHFVIVNASRANIGLAVGSAYHAQVANARAAGKHVGHYFFNGNIDPVVCADFFVNNLDFQAGESLWLDVESEASTGTVAWTPAKALAFINRVTARTGVVPGVYLNRSLMDGYNWSAVVATGAKLWIAYYQASPPPISWWPTWSVWQYTSLPLDMNKAQVGALEVAALNGGPIGDEFDMASLDDLAKVVDARVSITEDRLRRESRPARLFKRADGTLWIAGPTVVPRQIRPDTPEENDLNIAKGDAMFLGAGDVSNPQPISDTAWNWLVREHEAFRNSLASASVDVNALSNAIVAQLPQAEGLTQQNVVDAVRSLTFKAS